MEEIATIYERMRETFAERAGFTPGDGCDTMVRLYALSAEVQALLAQADWVLQQSFPQTAQGQYLDYHAASRALERAAARRAEGTLRFFTDGSAPTDYAIPEGTVCMTAAGTRFETTHAAVLPQGGTQTDVPARAVTAGAQGNAAAGAVCLLSAAPAGIARCVNPQAFTGGTDEEDDETLRARILASYRRLPNGANAAFYEQEALRVPGVAAAKAVGRARGIGTVDVYAAARGAAPSEALLETVRAALEEKREIAVDLRVLAPTTRAVTVRAALKVRAGAAFEEVGARAQEALQAYFDELGLGETVLTAKLTALLYAVEGVENCRVLAPTEDVSAGTTELNVLGQTELTELA